MNLMSLHRSIAARLLALATSLLALATSSAQAQEPLGTIATIELMGAPMTMESPAVSDLVQRA
jgi:hypothetical protein